MTEPRFLPMVGRAVLAGLPGILAIMLLIDPPEGVPAVVLAINPLVLVILAALAGAWASPRIGMSSRLVRDDAVSLAGLLPMAAIGLGAGLAVAILDLVTEPIWRGDLALPPTIVDSAGGLSLMLGITYGGMTEEVIMRWGLAGLVAALASMVMPRWAALWVAIIVAAIAFAAGHLPALLVTGAELSGGVLARTLILNALLGIAYGWALLFRNLESAMVMHGATHLGFAIMGLGVGLAA